jgi:hypothetical protein
LICSEAEIANAKVARPSSPFTQDARVSNPPISPSQKTLARVIAISRVNGWSVAIVAGLGTLLSLAFGDISGAAVGAMVGFAGYLEIRGNRQLRASDPEGMRWLINAQMFALAVILIYCTSRLGSFDADTMMANLTPEMETVLKEGAGIERADIPRLVHLTFVALYGSVGLTALIYQGGLAIYYRNKRAAVIEALARPPIAA